MERESYYRSRVKACGYRICGTLFTIIIAFIFTGSFPASISIGIVEMVSKILLQIDYVNGLKKYRR
jgi:hypothetical protein